MPDNEIISHEQAMPETAQEKFERERLTRRQALKRFGMTSAMTAFALFSVDDLAHIVGKAMQQRAGDNKVAGQIAKEFQQSGIALAAGPSHPCMPNYDCSGCASDSIAACCIGSSDPFTCCAKSSDQTKCCSGVTGVGKYAGDPEANDECNAVTHP